MKPPRVYRALPRRLRQRPVLIVGCGDVGQRIGKQLAARGLRVIGTVRASARASALRAAGIVPLIADLDAPRPARLGAWPQRLIQLAPPPAQGRDDPRTRRLVLAMAAARARLIRRHTPVFERWPAARQGNAASARTRALTTGAGGASPARWVYMSTTGVYGDAGGACFDETRSLAPTSERAVRRVAAEQHWRHAAARGQARASILRVPGIYAHDRLPLDRLRAGLPALRAEDDVYTNHIHADDLARICIAALWRGQAGRVVHAVDDSDLKMGDYFDRVADAAGLPRPPRLARAELAARVSPAMLSFMQESRRLANRRLKRELRVRLRLPSVDHTLAEAFSGVVKSMA
jgi:nucleoside-diphosphate-sugar epimerase